MATIDPSNEKERALFIERACSGDPIRDWYSEVDLVESLIRAYGYLYGVEQAHDRLRELL